MTWIGRLWRDLCLMANPVRLPAVGAVAQHTYLTPLKASDLGRASGAVTRIGSHTVREQWRRSWPRDEKKSCCRKNVRYLAGPCPCGKPRQKLYNSSSRLI